MDDGWLKVETGQDLSQAGVVGAVFWERMTAKHYGRIVSAGWPVDAKTLDAIEGPVKLIESYPWGETALYESDGVVGRIQLENSQLSIRVAGETRDLVEATVAWVREKLPLSEPREGEVPVTFWTYSPHGPSEYNRRIASAPWESIAANYPTSTRLDLERMMDGFTPSLGGQLILWQGEPGTGKTWALRALAWQWREWARFHYIVDPEQMLGEHANYLTTVLLSADDEPYLIGSESQSIDAPKERWRVLVLEDSGELIAADAKEKTGQAISRLLNVVDGMIGQGLRVLVLVTTNEELKKLHPAVSRPGRCAAQISFARFGPDEAFEWLRESGRGDIHELTLESGAASLAELYAIRDDYAKQPTSSRIGFAV